MLGIQSTKIGNFFFRIKEKARSPERMNGKHFYAGENDGLWEEEEGEMEQAKDKKAIWFGWGVYNGAKLIGNKMREFMP